MHETHSQQLLAQLRTRLLVMGATARIALEHATQALVEGNAAKAQSVVENDHVIDALEREIDAQSLNILIRTQPMAGDLRLVVGALRMVIDLERIGDEAAAIAGRMLLSPRTLWTSMALANEKMISFAQKLLNDALAAFQEQNADASLALCRLNDEITQEEMAIFESICHMAPVAGSEENPAIPSILIYRSLSRICHRAFNLAEHTCFIVTGENIKHLKAQ